VDEPEWILRSAVGSVLDVGRQTCQRGLEIVRVPGELVQDHPTPVPLPRAAARRMQARSPLDVVDEKPLRHLQPEAGAIEERFGHELGVDVRLALDDSDRLFDLAHASLHIHLCVQVSAAQQDFRADTALTPAFVERLLAEPRGLRLPPLEVPDECLQAHRLPALRTRRGARHRSREDRIGVVEIRKVDERPLGGGERALSGRLRARRQQARALVERDGVQGSSAVSCPRGSPLESRRGFLVGLGRRGAEMVCPRVLGSRRARQDAMKFAERRLVHGGERGLRQERVLETENAAFECQDALTNRRPEDALRVNDARMRQRLEPRDGRGRGEEHRIPRVVGQQPEALGRERREAVGNRQRFAGAHLLATPDERTPDLEGVERVAPRRRLDVPHDEPRERATEPQLEKPMQGGQRERSEVAALDRSGRQPGDQLDELVLAAPTGRQEGADGPAFEAAHREPEDAEGALVCPLHVVDGEQERRLSREQTNQAEGCDREGALIHDHALGIGPEQCDVERSPLRPGESREQPR
jgi:hypothetical protein